MARTLLSQVTAVTVTKPDDPNFSKENRRFSNTSLDATDEQLIAFRGTWEQFYPSETITLTLMANATVEP